MTRKSFFALFVLTLVLGCLETGARIYFLVKNDFKRSPIASYVNDDSLGWRPNPNFGLSYYSFNEFGFRGRSFRRGHPFTIVCLGGSTTFGTGNRDHQTYPVQLQEILEARGYKVEVVNAGVSGYNTQQLRRIIGQVLDITRPKLVLLHTCWNTGNPIQKYFKNDHWPTYFLFNNFFLPRWLDLKLRRFGMSLHYRSWPEESEQLERRATIAASSQIFKDYAEDIRYMVEHCSAVGVQSVFIYPPSLIYTGSVELAIKRFRGSKFADKKKAFYQMGTITNRIRERSLEKLLLIVQSSTAVLVDLNPPFKAMLPTERASLFYDQIHPLAQGNRVIATTLADELESMELLEGAVKINP